MLIYVYVFAMILGGVLLGSSLLLGGHDDADFDAGHDFDVDGDFDADGDMDADGDVHHGSLDQQVDFGHGGLDFFLWTFRSIRFWTFFLAFFGLTGVVMDGLGLIDSSLITLALSLVVGGTTGVGASAAIRALSLDTRGAAASSDDYIGKTVRVVVPVRPDGTGKVRLQLKGNTVDVLATSEDEEFASSDEAMIIEMEGTTAKIARVDSGDER